jgi:hypothetical protein
MEKEEQEELIAKSKKRSADQITPGVVDAPLQRIKSLQHWTPSIATNWLLSRWSK